MQDMEILGVSMEDVEKSGNGPIPDLHFNLWSNTQSIHQLWFNL